MMGGDYRSAHIPPCNYTSNAHVCQKMCQTDDECDAWTFIDAGGEPGEPGNSGDCFLKRGFPCPGNSSTTAKYCTSGYKYAQKQCGAPSAPRGQNTTYAAVPILPGETSFDMRILVDRSMIEAFFMGGRAVFTMAHAPMDGGAPPTFVNLISRNVSTDASVEVLSMSCGWTAD